MTFGEDFGKFLTKVDCVRIVDILLNENNVQLSEIAKIIGISRGAIYHWIWEMVKDIDDENKVKLLDLFYEKDKVRAISFIEDLLYEYMEFLNKEKRRVTGY
ncbi:helix-turn-helix domain-containing protein [Metallosphaera tengchongensis]|uniref:Helix-turn-helix domain-containing protein n=1 Tax=Metallosphaera tengchongensis TaxID=1532350 RepID=A0A6N0NZT0_9CREN|nr:helix-turn-helix domain-containing protein [Metallosphaera tengchongensis]QKR00868.1 helix-turn-helix domain-containing protein [Metallosphaera tengchongensis]